jgi:hypothetical protein
VVHEVTLVGGNIVFRRSNESSTHDDAFVKNIGYSCIDK